MGNRDYLDPEINGVIGPLLTTGDGAHLVGDRQDFSDVFRIKCSSKNGVKLPESNSLSAEN